MKDESGCFVWRWTNNITTSLMGSFCNQPISEELAKCCDVEW